MARINGIPRGGDFRCPQREMGEVITTVKDVNEFYVHELMPRAAQILGSEPLNYGDEVMLSEDEVYPEISAYTLAELSIDQLALRGLKGLRFTLEHTVVRPKSRYDLMRDWQTIRTQINGLSIHQYGERFIPRMTRYTGRYDEVSTYEATTYSFMHGKRPHKTIDLGWLIVENGERHYFPAHFNEARTAEGGYLEEVHDPTSEARIAAADAQLDTQFTPADMAKVYAVLNTYSKQPRSGRTIHKTAVPRF